MKTRFAAVWLVLGCCSLLAQTSSHPLFSAVPLSPEQVAVYRAFFSEYLSNDEMETASRINVGDITEKFQPAADQFSGCLKGFTPTSGITEVHHFDHEFYDLPVIRLVDAKKHKISDPGKAINKGDSVDSAVKAGFASGLLQVSEILFDPDHRLAAFDYSFVCGRLCGHGETIVFELKNGTWKRSGRRCAFWQA
jgi:hypothetical protein